MNHITIEELKKMADREGLILQGCGGDPQEWIDGVNETLTEAGILLDGSEFSEVYIFERENLTNMLFIMDGVKLDIGKLAAWRISTHDNFGGTWLSDYIPNSLDIIIDEPEDVIDDAPPIVSFGERQGPHSDEGFEGPRRDEPTNSAPYKPLEVYIENIYDFCGFSILLPAKTEELREVLEDAGIRDWRDMDIIEMTSVIDGLEDALTKSIKGNESRESFDELNCLAGRLAEMHPEEIKIFSSVIETGKFSGNIAEMINLTFTENLERFDIQPAYSAAQYGEFIINGIQGELAGAFNRLAKSEDQDDRALAAYIEKLEKHANYAAFAKSAIEEENSSFTKQGYLTKIGETETFYKGTLDIPNEYRLFTVSEEISKPPVKLERVDAAETLLKIHTLCGDNDSAAGALKLIESEHNGDFIMSVSKDGVSVFPAIDAYKRGGNASEKMLRSYAENGSGVRLFAVCNWRGNYSRDAQGETCDIAELNTAAFISNIKRHSTAPYMVNVEMKDGSKQLMDLFDFEYMPNPGRDKIAGHEMHFTEAQLADSERYYKSFINANNRSAEAVSSDTFMSNINRAYMSAAEYPQAGMLRITNEAAKEILIHGRTEVFRLAADEPERLSIINAMKPLCFADNKEVAINRDDIAALDNWAELAVKDTRRKIERGEHKKSKDKDGSVL